MVCCAEGMTRRECENWAAKNRSVSRDGPARAHLRQLGKDNVTAPRALALSDKQLALLQRAAASLPVGERDHFLQSVAAHLTAPPTDDAVIAAINAALDAPRRA